MHKTILRLCKVVLIALISPVALASSKPNIVYILVDNLGWGDVSVQGGSIPTRRIDQLASEGVRMTNFNVESQCTPTRSAIMTGRLPIRSGTSRIRFGAENGLAPWEYTIAELLSDEGYDTALYGKWHLGGAQGRLPHEQGFDEWYGIKYSTDAHFTAMPQFDPEVFPPPHIWKGTKGKAAVKVKEFDLDARRLIDREIVEHTEAFIARDRDAPFFAFVALTQVHHPMLVHPDFEGFTRSGSYGDILAELDYNVGRILDALDEAGLSENTLVILSGDNGAAIVPSFGGGSNGPWRGVFSGYEGGLRSVGMARWPAKINAGKVSDEIFASLDWLPTIANMIDAQHRIPKDRPIDGVNQSDLLIHGAKSPREHVVSYIGDQLFSVKWRSFKVHFFTSENIMTAPIESHLMPKIYELQNDPTESTNRMLDQRWVLRPVGNILSTLEQSMEAYPNIRPGERFRGYEDD